jgi:peptidoglycan/xylan/chitin deacetylase (PgdA/CDA1 family)
VNLNAAELDRGVFTLSLDFEMIWGTLDLFGPEGFRQQCEVERAVVIDRLLDLFEEFEVPATWCVLGHLFLDCCGNEKGTKHPEFIRPTHDWHQADWFSHDPSGCEGSDPIFYGRSLVQKIQACRVPQEIGSHSFSHVIFGDQGCSRQTAESEIASCVEVAQELGIPLRSFAFPRNQVGHLDVLSKYGFTCYRGPEPNWYEKDYWPGAIKRLAHLWNVVIAATPPVIIPTCAEAALWNIPGSMIYFPMHGLRRYIPLSRRVKRAIKGLDAAVRQKRIFHLWFHPTNLADQTEKMFDGLRRILEYATELRAQGTLSVQPMKALVPVDVRSIPSVDTPCLAATG